jgi:hypothetical protein
MPQQLILRDQRNAQALPQALVVQWQEGVPLTPRMLIAERVRIEWDARGMRPDASHRDRPAPLVETMRPDRPRSAQAAGPATLESVTALALEGFTRNAFFLVVDGRQATDLDEVIPLRPASEVTFVRLLALKGG